MDLFGNNCPCCKSSDFSISSRYTTKCDGERNLFRCNQCKCIFSETSNTILHNLKTPLSKITMVLKARTEGLGFNAACRTFNVGTNSLKKWECLFGQIKDVLMVYSLANQFIELIIEGDEIYTKIHHNTNPAESEGWTIMLMERASRFIWEFACGEKNEELFMAAITTLATLIENTEDLTLLTDGERRYSNCLFQICHDLIRNGKPGRPKKVLKKGVKTRVKNKGDQNHKKGPKRAKYQTPKPEHPETKKNLNNDQIHANHCEGQNSATRRRNSAFRRRTNTYAKCKEGLQRTLDTYWVFHNFIKKHFSTKEVPAVSIGIIDNGLSWEDIFHINVAF